MAIYVAIRKVSEDDEHVIYNFGPDELQVGHIQISKESGEFHILSEVPGDDKQAYSLCAKRKLVKHWRARELPDTTCWAS